MKYFFLLITALAVFLLAGAVVYHAETNRYRISPVAGIAGVYRIDTRSGDIDICSAAYQRGCVTLAEAHGQIQTQRQRVHDTAQQATESIDSFTKEKAQELRNLLDRFAPEDETKPVPEQ